MTRTVFTLIPVEDVRTGNVIRLNVSGTLVDHVVVAIDRDDRGRYAISLSAVDGLRSGTLMVPAGHGLEVIR